MSSWSEHSKNFPSAEERSPFFQCKVSLNLTSSEKVIFALVQQKFTRRKKHKITSSREFLSNTTKRNEKKNFMTFNFLFVFSTHLPVCPKHVWPPFLLRYHPSLLGNIKCVFEFFVDGLVNGYKKGHHGLPSVIGQFVKIFAFRFWVKFSFWCSLL